MGAFDRHLRSARKTYRARRDALLAAVAQHLPDWSVAGAVAGLHVWLQPPVDVDAAAMVSATAARGIAIEATAATSGSTDRLAGLVLCYARLDVDHAAEAVAGIADALGDISISCAARS